MSWWGVAADVALLAVAYSLCRGLRDAVHGRTTLPARLLYQAIERASTHGTNRATARCRAASLGAAWHDRPHVCTGDDCADHLGANQ